MNLYEKIAEVMQDVSYLAKDDSVATGGGKSYKAISEEKVTSTVRASLIKNKIVILPVTQSHRREDERIIDGYGKEKTNRITTVDVIYRIVNTEKPEEYIDVASSGTGVDTQDKGVGKAMTYAYKYMLLRTFAIPTGDDTDKISSDIYDETLYGKQTKTPTPKQTKAVEKAAKDFQQNLKQTKTATPEQVRALQEGCFALNISEADLCKKNSVDNLEELTDAQAAVLLRKMNEKADSK